MRMQQRKWLAVFVVGLVAAWWTAPATAADKDGKDGKASATGTWKSSRTNQNGETVETTYKLKDGEKLTGTVTRQGGEAREISNGKVKDGNVSFDVSGEFNGQKFTVHFKGKLAGDTITGKIEFKGEQGSREFDWTAKREK